MLVLWLFVAAAAILILNSGVSAAAESGSDSGNGLQNTPDDSYDNGGDNVPEPTGTNAEVSDAITNDPATWPSGDRIWDICRAIAIAEGANEAGSNPDRLNNPGDISDGFSTYGGESHSGSNITNFPDKATGWQWLYSKIYNAANGNSRVYSPYDTWNVFAKKYAGNWQNWVFNVTRILGVSPESTLNDYVGFKQVAL